MMIRQIKDTTYTLTYKQVKNINLRVKTDGTVCVSANKRVPLSKIDEFVLSKADWIAVAQERVKNKVIPTTNFTDEECLAVLDKICDRIYPLFKEHIKIKPIIKVRQMKSCWGVCHHKQGYITFNKALLSRPIEGIEYVVLHEFLHFLEPNHQIGFHKLMAKFIPDYKERKKLLK